MLKIFAIVPLFVPVIALAACVSGTCSATSTEDTTFAANLYVNGSVAKGSGTFMIDHPLDPRNSLLYHSFVESPDMKNLYDGIAILDEHGEAVIDMPRYFLVLNRDFRYLATPLGQAMPNLFLSKEVKKELFGLSRAISFKISGGEPGGRVSWQVTGIRHDPFSLANPVDVEVEKGSSGLIPAGEYFFPELYPHL